MPHTARKISSSGYYHVVPKGINGQLVFEQDEDRLLYLDYLRKATENTNVLLHAYCLMSNHAHLILEDRSGSLSEAIKYVHERYAMYYAEVSGQTGGIFQRRCWSEPIETDGYLLCAVRYTHANPAAAGICAASKYRWSSVHEYLTAPDIAYTKTVMNMLGGRQGFIEWSKSANSTAWAFPGSRLRNHLTDDEAIAIARQVIGERLKDLPSLSVDAQRPLIELLHKRGFTQAQLSRITGLSKRKIQWLLKD